VGGDAAVGDDLGVKVSLFLLAVALVASIAFAWISSAATLTALKIG
jgi:hypothetical protein